MSSSLILSLSMLTLAVLLVMLGWSSYQAGILLKGRHHKSVLVETCDGRAISGILLETDSHSIVITQASEAIDGELVSVDGVVVVLRPNISLIQFP